MLNDDTNARPTAEESYSTAIGSSNLKFDAERPGAVQMIIAAGLSPHTLGKALMRLRTEWDTTAKPAPATVEQVRALSTTFQREPCGLVRLLPHPGRDGKVDKPELVKPMVAAQRQADDWYQTEMHNLLQRLKSLPMIRGALNQWAAAEGIEGAPHVVAAVLLWWLSNTCPVCHGAKNKVVEGTGRTSAKLCKECRGSGEMRVPHGFLGRKVLGYMRHCQGNATAHLKAMKWRHQAPAA